jgi:hypothetical protein
MPKVKFDIDDAEAVLSLVDVLTGKRSAAGHFFDRHNPTRLAPYFAVAVMNCEAALKDQRQRSAPKVAKRSAAHPR